MKLFMKYICQYRKNILFFLLYSVVFASVLLIYDSNIEAVFYAFVICSLTGAVIIVYGFLRFRRKYLLLREIYINLPLMTDNLPEAENITEEEMHNIITRLVSLNSENVTRTKSIQQNNCDYFTVWVHQIKTPISAIQMILQTNDSSMNHEISAELFLIEQYAEMALQYIRLDSESSDFVIKSYDLDLIIRQAVRRYAPLFIRRKVRLDYHPTEAEVLTDEKWLVFVIEQLLSNAVKYTAKGCVTIKFKDNKLSVSDTGIGIAPDDLPRIFEKGYTGMSGRTDKKSTGLGLYLCKNVCDKLGHELSAHSEVGKGSEFFVDLSSKKLCIE